MKMNLGPGESRFFNLSVIALIQLQRVVFSTTQVYFHFIFFLLSNRMIDRLIFVQVFLEISPVLTGRPLLIQTMLVTQTIWQIRLVSPGSISWKFSTDYFKTFFWKSLRFLPPCYFDQDYSVCVRRESGYCGIEWSVPTAPSSQVGQLTAPSSQMGQPTETQLPGGSTYSTLLPGIGQPTAPSSQVGQPTAPSYQVVQPTAPSSQVQVNLQHLAPRYRSTYSTQLPGGPTTALSSQVQVNLQHLAPSYRSTYSTQLPGRSTYITQLPGGSTYSTQLPGRSTYSTQLPGKGQPTASSFQVGRPTAHSSRVCRPTAPSSQMVQPTSWFSTVVAHISIQLRRLKKLLFDCL